MRTKTLDGVVRGILLERQLPLHYYTRHLHHAITQLEELSFDLEIATVKSVKLTVDAYQRASLASLSIDDIVDVSAEFGEKLLPMERDITLNKLYNYEEDGITRIPYPDGVNLNFDSELNYNLLAGTNNMNTSGELIGRVYGKQRTAHLVYDIDRDHNEIVFANTMTLADVVVTYVSASPSITSANTVHPYAVSTIKAYATMMAKKAEGAGLGEVQMYQLDFQNKRRVLRSRMNDMSYADYLGSLRRGLHASLKN